MDHVTIVETIAIAVGIIVIAIETIIIFMLRNHVELLEKKMDQEDTHLDALTQSMNEHLKHLNDHSHEIESRLETMMCQICGPIKSTDREQQNIKPQKEEKKSPKTIDIGAKI